MSDRYYRIASLDAITIVFGEEIHPEISAEIMRLYRRLHQARIPGIIEVIPSYATLYIQFDRHRFDPASLYATIEQIESENDTPLPPPKTITIPTWYDPRVGYDLERVARHNHLSIDEVIAHHTQVIYRVYAIGFAPGFGYLGTNDPRIATPRLDRPRSHIPKGSVAIANLQSAVYPLDSPGGWNILGRTYLAMFDPGRENASLLAPGDRVRFVPIDAETFRANGGHL